MYSPPFGSPFVTTWMVALSPALSPSAGGTTTLPRQKLSGPCSEKVGTSTVLKALPGSLPSASSTWMCDDVCESHSWTGPPESGQAVRLLVALSKPPQGNLPIESSLKPRAGG